MRCIMRANYEIDLTYSIRCCETLGCQVGTKVETELELGLRFGYLHVLV